MPALPRPLLRRLAGVLGISLPVSRVLSPHAVEMILARWVAMRYSGARDSALGMPRCGAHAEPGWLIWCSTVAAKVACCPIVPWWREVGWEVPAVEMVAAFEWELGREDNEWRQRIAREQREGRRAQGGLPRHMVEAIAILQRLRASDAYRVGIERLCWSLGKCVEADPAFAGAVERMASR